MSARPSGGTQPGWLGRPAPRPSAGAVRMRLALVLAGCGVLSVGLSACESTEHESARIGRENEAVARVAAPRAAAKAHAVARSRGRGHGSAHGVPDRRSAYP
jgi:hypothetical protein